MQISYILDLGTLSNVWVDQDKVFQFQNIWSQWTTSQKKLFFVLEYVQIAPSSHKIEVDIVNAGMSQTLSYFQSSVKVQSPPMELQTSKLQQ